MRLLVFSVLLLSLFSALVMAHEEDGSEVQSCAAPVLGEATIPLWQFGALAALFVAGAVATGFGVSFRKWPLAGAGVLMFLIAAVVYASGPGFNLKTGFFEKNQHVHADIQVYIQGVAVNFSERRFQSTNERALTEYVHFHDGNGHVVHLHASGVPLSYLFGTFDGVLNQSCIQVAAGEPLYCTDASRSLRFYVNGNWNPDSAGYQLRDLDQLLISYGPATEDVKSLLSTVTAEACIVSGKCPVPPGYDLHLESCSS
ncbi:hypothetical protein HYV43_04820 [Candidatus Micrarchaeota archaeon]|nr:hypothetical protein [Candidatus Micrarchaeota archaeon]